MKEKQCFCLEGTMFFGRGESRSSDSGCNGDSDGGDDRKKNPSRFNGTSLDWRNSAKLFFPFFPSFFFFFLFLLFMYFFFAYLFLLFISTRTTTTSTTTTITSLLLHYYNNNDVQLEMMYINRLSVERKFFQRKFF